MLPKPQFPRFFSLDSAKAVKATAFGYLNAINYMAPASTAGVGNLCPKASAGCATLCLGLWSGQASMVRNQRSDKPQRNPVRESRERKARYFMRDRQAYLLEMSRHIARHYAQACSQGLTLCVRPNGSSDIAYEGLHFQVSPELAGELARTCSQPIVPGRHTIFSLFPFVQFVDYTKLAGRFDRQLPSNYHLTFSRSEDNETEARALLARGVNVAIVFSGPLPRKWYFHRVIDGDKHDLRHLDPRSSRGGVVVGLSPKGARAKRDTSGFVVRL